MLELLIAMLIPIDGAKYNTRKLQEENFTNIQIKGNSLVGDPVVKKAVSSSNGLVHIDGAVYNTKEKQLANFENMVIKDGGLWGKQKAVKAIAKPQPKFSSVGFSDDSIHQKQSNEPYYNKNVTGTGIQLIGTATDKQKQIAEEYSKNFKMPIMVRMIPDLGERKGREVAGATIYMKDGTREVELKESIGENDFRRAILHEVGHQIFNYDEMGADSYAERMMEIFNNQK